MIKHIYIQNYALIESLEIDFDSGYSVITGETGAGKSILLGALSLILGNRADTNILKDKEKKCVVETHFDIQRYSLKVFYDVNDIDYDEITVVRREISPSGRSRAFINDTPVNLTVLKDLSIQLTDIHSQHHNLNLNNHLFQLKVLDAFAKLNSDVEIYRQKYYAFKKAKSEYSALVERANKEKSDFEYLQFRFDELEEAQLKEGEQSEIESELKQLTHAEEIKQNLTASFSYLSDEETGISNKLRESLSALKTIQKYYEKADELIERLESTKIEIDDISGEIETFVEDIEYNPERIEFLKERIDTIYDLQNKHKVSSVEDLIKIKEDLQVKLNDINSYDQQIAISKKQVEQLEKELIELSDSLSENRREASKQLEEQIVNLLQKLAMPNAEFVLLQSILNEFNEYGKDDISFLFSANKHVLPQDISEIASGGEISRLMLSIKSVISDAIALPAIIFDEIDTGVSGDIAEKIGHIMKEMSENMQVISITHLPQVAAKADYHYKVYKTEDEFDTLTKIKKLTPKERITELASMLSGENITDAALKNAEELLK
ncbi:MAG: DNA repair protein RecN [Bacteroidales bacterium]|nr:DNA repair protein RecN [Bacteroidales bacterium]